MSYIFPLLTKCRFMFCIRNSTDIQRYHLRQQRMAQGLQLLQEVPWLGDVNYATLGQLAYTMTFSAIPAKTVVVRAGDVVENIYLVARGFVTMYPSRYMSRGARKGGDGVVRSGGEGSCCSLKLAVVMRGRGCVLGEREFRGGVVAYEHTYEAAEETEVFALPRSALEVITSRFFTVSTHAFSSISFSHVL